MRQGLESMVRQTQAALGAVRGAFAADFLAAGAPPHGSVGAGCQKHDNGHRRDADQAFEFQRRADDWEGRC